MASQDGLKSTDTLDQGLQAAGANAPLSSSDDLDAAMAAPWSGLKSIKQHPEAAQKTSGSPSTRTWFGFGRVAWAGSWPLGLHNLSVARVSSFEVSFFIAQQRASNFLFQALLVQRCPKAQQRQSNAWLTRTGRRLLHLLRLRRPSSRRHQMEGMSLRPLSCLQSRRNLQHALYWLRQRHFLQSLREIHLQ